MPRLSLILSALSLLFIPVFAQQSTPPPTGKMPPSYSAIPVGAAAAQNPVKSSPESLTRAKKWWTLDCEMCHGKTGDGKGEIAKDMKLTIVDFTDPATLKDHSDGELFYIIKNGHNDMPAEGPRVKTEENWDLVNYVRSLARQKTAEAKPQP